MPWINLENGKSALESILLVRTLNNPLVRLLKTYRMLFRSAYTEE